MSKFITQLVPVTITKRKFIRTSLNISINLAVGICDTFHKRKYLNRRFCLERFQV